MAGRDLDRQLDVFLAEHEADLVDFRRDLHAHPEIGYAEHRTTEKIARRLEAAGIPHEDLVLPNEIHGFLRQQSWLSADTAAARFFDETLAGRN